jgi:MFS family permease
VILGVVVLSASMSSTASNVFTGSMVGALTDAMGWTRTELTAAVTAGTVLAAAAQPVLGRLADQYGARVLIPAGTLVFVAGMLTIAGMDSLWQFYVGYVLARAIGSSSMGGVVAQTAIVNWFVRMRGRTVGMASMALPLAQSVLVPLAQVVVARQGWRAVYLLVSGGAVLFAFVPAVVLMRRRPEDVGLEPDGGAGAGGPLHRSRVHGREFSFRAGEALRTRAFWLMIVSQFLTILASGAISFHIALFWTERGLPVEVGALSLSMFALAGGLSNGVWGVLSERVSERLLCIFVQVLAVAVVLAMLVSESVPVALLLSALYGVAGRGEGTIFNLLMATYYGRGHFGAIAGIFGPFSSVGLGIGPLIAAFGYDRNASYQPVWLALAGLHAAAVMFLLVLRRPVLPARAAQPDGHA